MESLSVRLVGREVTTLIRRYLFEVGFGQPSGAAGWGVARTPRHPP